MPDKKSYNADDAPPPRGLQSGPRSGVKDPSLGHQFSTPQSKWTSADVEAFVTRPGRRKYDPAFNKSTTARDVVLPVEKKRSVAKPRSMSKR